MYKKVLILLFFIPFQLLFAQTSMLKDFPEGSTPEEIGKRLAYRFLTEKHALHVGKWIGYPETFYWNGALRYAYLAKDKELLNRLQDKFEPLFTEEKALQPIMNHVDVNMFGSLPLELYLVTKDCLMPIPNGRCLQMQSRKKRNGLKKDILGKHVCGLMICI